MSFGTETTPQCIDTLTLEKIVEIDTAGDIILSNVFKPSPIGEPSDVIPASGYKNYLFYPPILTPTRKYSLQIFTRWGQLLYKTNDPERGWNGYFRGRLCDEGESYAKDVAVFWSDWTNGVASLPPLPDSHIIQKLLINFRLLCCGIINIITFQ